MGKIPRVSGKKMVQFLKSQGFTLLRVHGSHHFMVNGSLKTSVPVHGNDTLRIGTLHGILRDIGMHPNEFSKLLK